MKLDEQKIYTDPLNDEHSAGRYVVTDPLEVLDILRRRVRNARGSARIHAEMVRLAKDDPEDKRLLAEKLARDAGAKALALELELRKMEKNGEG